MKKNKQVQSILSQFPKVRSTLPPQYQEIYKREYVLNRGGGSFLTRVAAALEGWMHRRVAQGAMPGGAVLEIGAGNLNHLAFENSTVSYDVIEPFKALYEGSGNAVKIRRFYDDINDIPLSFHYQRVISIAVLEHLDKLPTVVAKAALLLDQGGRFQAGIPSEGGFLWGAAWRFSTGIGFWLRNKLPYGVLMRHEHVNDASDIESVVRYFFKDVSISRYPLPLRHLSFYSYIEAQSPDLKRAAAYLRGDGVSLD